MLLSARHTDVVVVGAGLAGLRTAHHLVAAGVSVIVVEASQEVGGRMATDTVDGYRLDRGGQLLDASFAGAEQPSGLEKLRLLPLAAGPVVRSSDSAGDGGGRAGRRIGDAIDRARLNAVLGRITAVPEHRLLARPETTAARAPLARGLSPRTADGYLRPLLTALLHDPDLTTSSRCADLALRRYARGRLCMPSGGAATVPELLASGLPAGTIRLGVRATAVATDSVTTAEHGRISCRAVVVATDARAAARLLPGLRVPEFLPVTVVHHAAGSPPPYGPALVLEAARRGPVGRTLAAGEVDPSRVPPGGGTLVTTTLLGPRGDTGDAELDRTVRDRLAALYGVSTRDWQLLSVRHDPFALPSMSAPHDMHRPVRLLAGLYVCGDHRDTSSAQGALDSGRRAAEQVLRDLGVTPPLPALPRPVPTAA